MKVKVTAFVVRDDKGNIIDIESISDMYSSVSVEYTADMVTFEEMREAIKGWSDVTKKAAYFKFLEHGLFTLHSEAKDAISIGKIRVGVEQKEVDWT